MLPLIISPIAFTSQPSLHIISKILISGYLHEVCSPSTIHKNIKSANVLLDAELNPHLSDYGLASFYKDTSENLGPGYTAPECTKPSAYTLKSDVYSFGVVMLELLTDRKPFDSYKPRSEQSLVRWAAPQLHDIDALTHMVDPALRGLYPPKSLSRFADVVALCVQPESEFRPPMSEVVQALVWCVQRTSINKRLGGDLETAINPFPDSFESQLIVVTSMRGTLTAFVGECYSQLSIVELLVEVN